VLYRVAFITKTFTGTAIIQLHDAGMLDLDDPVVNWVPELASSASPETIGGVTITRLLSHEYGLVSEPPGSDFMAELPRYQGVAARNLERVSEIFTAVPPGRGWALVDRVVGHVTVVPAGRAPGRECRQRAGRVAGARGGHSPPVADDRGGLRARRDGAARARERAC
jgi:hypothetical protein